MQKLLVLGFFIHHLCVLVLPPLFWCCWIGDQGSHLCTKTRDQQLCNVIWISDECPFSLQPHLMYEASSRSAHCLTWCPPCKLDRASKTLQWCNLRATTFETTGNNDSAMCICSHVTVKTDRLQSTRPTTSCMWFWRVCMVSGQL